MVRLAVPNVSVPELVRSVLTEILPLVWVIVPELFSGPVTVILPIVPLPWLMLPKLVMPPDATMEPVPVCAIAAVETELLSAPVNVILPLPVWFKVPAFVDVPLMVMVPVPPWVSVVPVLDEKLPPTVTIGLFAAKFTVSVPEASVRSLATVTLPASAVLVCEPENVRY